MTGGSEHTIGFPASTEQDEDGISGETYMTKKKKEKVLRTILEHRLIILGLDLPNVRDRCASKEHWDEP